MTTAAWATVFVLATLIVLAAREAARPARTWPTVPGWRAKGLVFAALALGLGAAVSALLSGRVDAQLLPGHRLGPVGGAIAGIVASELVVYWAHRLHHRVDFLWRWVHQLHHSAERVDVYGASYFHPFEILEGAIVGVLLFEVVFGLPPEIAIVGGAWQAFAALFQHANVRTPVWLGYLIQRPEAHGVHHARGAHAGNYANLPLWDLVFGTFVNSPRWDGEAGFAPGASARLGEMLRGRDVTRAPAGR